MPDDFIYPSRPRKKLNYGVSNQLPATSGHNKSKQQTFTLMRENIKQLCKKYREGRQTKNIARHMIISLLISIIEVPTNHNFLKDNLFDW